MILVWHFIFCVASLDIQIGGLPVAGTDLSCKWMFNNMFQKKLWDAERYLLEVLFIKCVTFLPHVTKNSIEIVRKGFSLTVSFSVVLSLSLFLFSDNIWSENWQSSLHISVSFHHFLRISRDLCDACLPAILHMLRVNHKIPNAREDAAKWLGRGKLFDVY